MSMNGCVLISQVISKKDYSCRVLCHINIKIDKHEKDKYTYSAPF
jgi:hypothetical protein